MLCIFRINLLLFKKIWRQKCNCLKKGYTPPPLQTNKKNKQTKEINVRTLISCLKYILNNQRYC